MRCFSILKITNMMELLMLYLTFNIVEMYTSGIYEQKLISVSCNY